MLDISQCSVFKPVTIRENEKENQPLIPLFFANKGLEAIYLGNILHHKSVRAMSPPYFKDQSRPIFSHIYTSHITHTISNYNNDSYIVPRQCGGFKHLDNENLCKILANGLKYRKPQFINWKYNFKLLMDSDTLSEWVKTVRSLINSKC